MKVIEEKNKLIKLEKKEKQLMEMIENLIITYKINDEKFYENNLSKLSIEILEMIEEYAYKIGRK